MERSKAVYNPNEIDSDVRYNAKDYKGEHIMTVKYDDKRNYAELRDYYLPTGPCGDVFLTAELDMVGGTGFEASVSLVLDLDNWKDSGINFSFGSATGLNVGVGIGGGYVKRELEGTTPVGMDGNFGALPFSIATMTDDEGFNGASVSFGPGMGLSTSTQKSYTFSVNSVINFFNKLGQE